MRRKTCLKLSMCTGGILLAGMARPGEAQLAVTGNLDSTAVTYGANIPGTEALATQTLNTAFSDNNVSTGATDGSELDAAYGVVENNYLYLFLAGNLQTNSNTLQIWIDDGRAGGQTTLNAAATAGSMKKMNGSTFSPGFSATYALEMNMTGGNAASDTFFVDQYNLVQNTATFLGQFNLTNGLGSSTETGSNETADLVGVTNTNTAGVTASGSSTSQATAANQANAQAVGTGIEIGIPLATLGNPTGNIRVMAGINGSGDSGLSNQMLPGLPVGFYDVKTAPSATVTNPYYYSGANGLGFNFSSLSEFFTVPNSVVANGVWQPSTGGTWDGSTTANWSNGHIPNAVGDSASFENSAATSTSTVTLAISPTVGTLNFNDIQTYVIAAASGQTLTLDNGGSIATAQINDDGGTHYITAPVVMNSNVLVTCLNHGDVMNIGGNIQWRGRLARFQSGHSQPIIQRADPERHEHLPGRHHNPARGIATGIGRRVAGWNSSDDPGSESAWCARSERIQRHCEQPDVDHRRIGPGGNHQFQ